MAPKIAYMILAHHQPAQLARLVQRLDGPNVHFFVHIDTRSPIRDTVGSRLKATNKVTVISKRAVNWMGFTMIEAELDLINSAVASGQEFKYYVLMSGQDYPIKSNSYINNFFTEHNEDFIFYYKMAHLGPAYVRKHAIYHFYDVPYINPRSPRKIPALVRLYFGLLKKVEPMLPKRKFYKGMELYFGSQWFALRQETIMYVLQFLKDNPGYISHMRYSEGPDEHFMQTIIMNSERRHNVYDYARYAEWLKTRKEGEHFHQGYASLRYMDWSEHLKVKPAVLEMSYWETLKNSPELFARKVDEKTSAELMDKLDQELLLNGQD